MGGPPIPGPLATWGQPSLPLLPSVSGWFGPGSKQDLSSVSLMAAPSTSHTYENDTIYRKPAVMFFLPTPSPAKCSFSHTGLPKAELCAALLCMHDL